MPYSWSDEDGLPDRIREICSQDTTDEKLLELLAECFRDLSSNSALKTVLFDLADIELQAALDAHEQNIRCQIEAEVEAEYDAELETAKREYESRATYDLIEERFLSEPQFRERVLSRIRKDLSESKVHGFVSPLFERVLDSCDEGALISFLMENHRPELVEKFHAELVEWLLEEHGVALREEIKADLLKNSEYMQSLKEQLLDQMARRILDDV
jgi:hypothetical protein